MGNPKERQLYSTPGNDNERESNRLERGLFQKFYDDLIKKAGPIGARAMEQFVDGELTPDEVDRILERAPDFQAFQEQGLELLEAYGIVERVQGRILVDIESIKTDLTKETIFHRKRRGFLHEKLSALIGDDTEKLEHVKDIIRTLTDTYGETYLGDGDVRTFLFNTFYDTEVISKSDWDNANNGNGVVSLPVQKPLFYTPANRNAAFDKTEIRKEQFHIGPWEIKQAGTPDVYSPFHTDVPYVEACLAAIMYHPSYGDGTREHRQLMVSNRGKDGAYDNSDRSAINRDWLKDTGVVGALFQQRDPKTREHIAGPLLNSPWAYLEQGGLPNLQDADLIRSSDFRAMTQTQEHNFSRYITQRNGSVMLDDKIQYTLGKVYSGGTHMVLRISDSMYGVVKKDEQGVGTELVAVVDRVASHDTDLKQYTAPTGSIGSDYQRIGLRTLQKRNLLREFDVTQPEMFLPRKKDETDGAYAARANEVVGFADFLKLKKEIQTSAHLSLDALTPHEQAMLLSFFQHVDDSEKRRVFDFIKTYGMDGARCFAACAHDSDAGIKLLTIMDSGRSRADMIPVLRKYLEVSDSSAKVEADIESFFLDETQINSVDTNQIVGQVMKRALRLLTEYADGKGAKLTYNEIEKHFNSLKKDMILFGSIFKAYCTAKKGHVDIDVIRGLSVTSSSPAELTPKQIQEMRTIYAENRQSLSSNVADVMTSREFDTRMASHDSTMYVLQKEGEIFSYALIEPIDETTVYAGLFNTHIALQGDSIGWIFSQEIMKVVGGSNNIVMKTRIDNPALGLYKDRLGFQENSAMYEDPHTHMFYINMIRYATPESGS